MATHRPASRGPRLTRKSSGLLLLFLAVLAALAIGLLAWKEGALDPWLALVGAVGVAGGVAFVVVDARYARRTLAATDEDRHAPR